MAKKTAGVEDLVQEVLRTFSPPYGEDIIEDVCLAIEHNPAWRRRYNVLGDELQHWVVNCWIGRYTKALTGLESINEVDTKRCTIIKSYTKLSG
jgi:hypothetical protein